jgi:hypothetical protein
MQCQQCGYDNPPDEILCLKCGLVLKENLVKEGATQHFDNLGNVPISTRWGTSRLGNEPYCFMCAMQPGHSKYA